MKKLAAGLMTMGSVILAGCQTAGSGSVVSTDNLKEGPAPAVVPALRYWGSAGQTLDVKGADIAFASGFEDAANILAEELKITAGLDVDVSSGSPANGEIAFVKDSDYKDEAYAIVIDEGVTVHASTHSGAYYGAQTLIQLLQANGKGELAKGVIKDSPSYPVRSMLLDVGRKFIPVDGLKDWIRMLGRTKMNELHLHLNDNSWGKYPGYRLESKKFPDLPSKDGFYTFKQIRELQDFAKLHGVTIVPEIDSPGHALAFTMLRPDIAQKEMNRNGFGLAYLDLGNEDAIKFMEDIFDEVAPLFDSPYLHIGTDEYRIGLIKDAKERARYGELFRTYINRMNKYLRTKHNKVVRIWSGYEHMPGTTEPDTSVVIDMWETTDAVNKSKAGYKFVNSTHFYTYVVPGMPYYGVSNGFIYNEWNPRIFNKRKPKTGILPEGAPGLLGGKLHVWNDGGPTGYTWNEIARLTWPSMLAMSEKLWGTKGSKDYNAFRKRTAGITEFPGLPLLQRNAKADDKGIVWNHKGDKHFIANSNKALNLVGDPKNLEYPWTASFTLTRQSDTIGKDTLISSDLAAFYVDLEHTTKDKKTKKEKKVRGVACIRAHQAPLFEPIQSNRPDILVFNYQVPFNQKVTLTFVGEERQTSLYVNGKLIQTIRKQMVCPVEFLGAKASPESFQGILHKAVIINKTFKASAKDAKGGRKSDEAIVPELYF